MNTQEQANRLRTWIRVIIVAAAVVRLSYVAFGNVLPVMWDARIYASAAIGLISFVDAPEEHADAGTAAYRELSQEYIHGEQIDWLYYDEYTLKEARDAIFFGGPLYPAALAAIFAISPTADFTVAKVFNIVMDLVSCWLLMLIAIRLIGGVGACIAGGVYALYFPFILCSSMLLLETMTTCLILLTVWLLITAIESEHANRRLWLAGLCMGAIVLTKPSAMLIFAPIGVAAFLWYRGTRLYSWMTVRAVLIPLVSVFAIWTAATSVWFDQLSVRDPHYAEANLRQSSSIRYDGYDLDEVERDFWTKPVFGEAMADPMGYAGLLARKEYRLWSQPYNDLGRWWIIPSALSEWLHVFVLICGLAGLAILARSSFRSTAFPLSIVLYYALLHAVFHSISRYNVSAMPMVILGAGGLIGLCWKHAYHAVQKAPLAYAIVAMVLGCAIPTLVSLAGWTHSSVLTAVACAIQIGCIAACVGMLLSACSVPSRHTITATATIAGLCVLVYLPYTVHEKHWAEYNVTIRDTSTMCGVRIYASRIEPVNDEDFMALLIDMKSGARENTPFVVTVGEQSMQLALELPPLSSLAYPKPVYGAYARFEQIRKREFRQWAIIPFEPSLAQNELARQGYIDIAITSALPMAQPGGEFAVFGRTDVSNMSGTIPAIRQTSIERWVTEGDPRLPMARTFLSDSAVSYYIQITGGDTVVSTDLSDAAGQQTGRYNVYLMHFKPDWSLNIY